MRMMQENVSLVKEINELRREIKQMKMSQRAQAMLGSTTSKLRGFEGSGGPGGDEVARLRQRIDELESGSAVAMRPISRERLPTMDGVPLANAPQ